MDYVLELCDVTKNYADFKLDQISFAVPKGCICGFIGQNGAGKTTTIQLILDIIKRDAGHIRVFGNDIRQSDPVWKEKVGVVFDEMGFHEFLKVNEINCIMKNIYKNWSEETFYTYLKRFSLPGRKRCGSFSRGMRMKLQIAAALSHGAELLVMDEPTSGLDPIVRNEILQIFQEFVMEENHTILLSSHITGDLERIADMVVFIDHGKIILQGDKNDILENHRLLKCRKGDLERIDKEDIVSVRQSAFSTEVLVSEQQRKEKKYEQMAVEQPTLEEIMIFYADHVRKKTWDESRISKAGKEQEGREG